MVEEKPFFQKVSENEDGSETIIDAGTDYLTYDESALTYIMVNALKEQQAIIDAQAAELEAVKSRLDQMDQSMAQCCLSHSNESSHKFEHVITDEHDGSWLGQNVPNPFGQMTSIKYYVPESSTESFIIISDMKGQEMQRFELTNGNGEVNFNASDLSTGTYVYTLINDGNVIATKKMVMSH